MSPDIPLLADFDGDTLSEFTYWFIDPFKADGKPVKADNDYLKLLRLKRGQASLS